LNVDQKTLKAYLLKT